MKKLSSPRLVTFLALTLLALALAACNNEKAATEAESRLSQIGLTVKMDPELPLKTIELLTTDLQSLAVHQGRIANADPRAQYIFSTRQGGTILSYLNERLRYFMPLSSDADIYRKCTLPLDLPYQAFLTEEAPAGSTAPLLSASPNDPLSAEAKGEMGAANMGAALWLLATVNDIEVSCRVGQSEFVIDGTRTGLMMFGPGYKPAEKVLGPLKVKLPPEYRQSILVHEARHSDCPTGLSEEDIEVARLSRNNREFDRDFRGRRCGHLHTLCPEGHSLAGLAACDDFGYGAYYFGAIHAAAAMTYLQSTPEGSKGLISDASIMSAVAADSFGRLLVPGQSGSLELGSTNRVGRSGHIR